MPLRLLLVEDDPGDAYLAQAMLEEAGVGAQWCHVGRLADVDLGALGDWADCALVDLGLPDSHGLEAVRSILRRAPRVPVVVVSGNTDRELALSAVREGAQDYLVKGYFDGELLSKAVRYAIERKLLERELHQARQLARLGRLAGGMAHHFNNLHAIIINCADFVAEALSGAPPGGGDHLQEAREDVEHIRRAARRAADLTRQLTIFAEQDSVRPQVIQLNDVIEGARETLSARIGTGIALDVTLTRDLRQVLADRGHIEQLLAVVAGNARDAMPDGGRLAISTANVHDGQTYSDAAARTCARLQIRDTGMGIPSDILDSVFDPFFTTKPAGQGIGLGLAVVHAIMARWDGRVDLDSRPGAGTTVTMLFPATAQPG